METIKRVLTPVKSVRKFCLLRCEVERRRVRLCKDESCPLHPYRLGRQPGRAGIGGCRSSVKKTNNSSYGSGNQSPYPTDLDCSPNLGRFNAKSDTGQVGINARGQIKIVRLGNQGLVITLNTETSRDLEDQNATRD